MNKYQEALDRLETISSEDIGEVLVGEILNNEIKTLQEIIDMHNKPLKREEIKKGMWVWHTHYEEYFKVICIENYRYGMYVKVHDEALDTLDIKFEEGKFYRYQPLSEV